MNKNITPTVEGGLLTAIAVILGLASTYLPIVGVVIEFFCPVPFAVLTVRRGVKIGITSLAVSFMLLAMFTGPILATRIALTLNVCGIILGYFIAKNFSTVKCFLATFTASFASQILMVAFLAVAMDINFADMEITTLKETFEESFAMYESVGIDQATLNEMKKQTSQVIEVMAYLMPTILLLLALINAIACYITSKWIFKKLNIEFVPPLPNFSQWRLPVIFLYLTAFAIIGLYWGGTREWELLYTVSINTLIFSMGAGLIQGYSILSFVADKYDISKFWRRIIYLFILFNGLLLQILSFIGLFDMLFDYRKKYFGEK